MANKFQKQFHIFKSMDSDAGNPSGYIKIEINGQQAKLQLSLNNLLNRQGSVYQLYGIMKDNSNLSYTVICDIPYINGRADVKVSANCLSLEQINIYAIILRLSGNLPELKCPLVAYAKEELDWRNEFDSLVLVNERSKNNLNIETGDSKEKGFDKPETIENADTENVSNSIRIDKSPSDSFEEAINNQPQEKINNSTDEINEVEMLGDSSEKIKEPVCTKKTDSDKLNIYEDVLIHSRSNVTKDKMAFDTIEKGISAIEQIGDAKAAKDEQNIEGIEKIFGKSIGRLNEDNKEAIDYEIKDAVHIKDKDIVNKDSKATLHTNNQLFNDMKLNFSGKFESVITSIYNADKSSTLTSVYNNATAKKEPELNLDDKDILGSVEENFKDISSIELDKIKGRAELNLPDLKDELNKSFESYNPFKMKSKNFNWWKINSPGYLNNILFRNNIRTYLLFNPKVMLAHYKYRYIIFGIRIDRRTGKEYFICGIPGVYSIDENPFGSMGSWAQTEGYKPKYGAFGYWLIMIDPKTGKLIKVR